MKEKREDLTPLQMEKIEQGRLSLEQAQELANLIVTKFEAFDPKKLGPEDYEQAMREIENLKKWSKGDMPTTESLMIVLKESPVLTASFALLFTVGPSLFLYGSVTSPELAEIIITTLFTATAIKAWSEFPQGIKKDAQNISEKKLSHLKDETEARLAAEEKHNKPN